jgi:hypothetical protein
MSHRYCLIFGFPFIWIFSAQAFADDFDRVDGAALAAIPESKSVTAHQGLTLAQIGNLPVVLRGTRSPLFVVKTDQGNLARVLAVAAFRKPAGGADELVPVLVLERFACFEADKATTRIARGHDVMLFDGFRFDLDSGQVVPGGQGGDIQFQASGPEGPRLTALEGAVIYTLTESPLSAANPSQGPSAGRAVVAGDFAGRYRVFANGQWSGTLELKVGAEGTITGQFRSDLNGSIYPVAGQASADVPHKVRFAVRYPRSRQDFEGFLWTEGKGAMAGVVSLLDHPYGFFAIREGGHYAPEGDEAGPLTTEADRPGRVLIELEAGDRYRLEGKTLKSEELIAALKPRADAEPAPWILLRIPPDLPFADVGRAIEVARAAGITSVRLAIASGTGVPKPE